MDQDEFLRVHGILLASAGIPQHLWSKVYEKVTREIFDGGDFFDIEQCEGSRQRRLLLSRDHLRKESDVFLVDHAWSFRLPDARKQLENMPELVDRMGALMCILNDPLVENATENLEDSATLGAEKKRSHIALEMIKGAKLKAESGIAVQWLELDELLIDDEALQSFDLPANFPELVGLSLWGNKIESLEVVMKILSGLPFLRALWLNETPIDAKMGDSAKEAILTKFPKLEIYNSQLTKSYSQWAIYFCAELFGTDGNYSDFLLHKVTNLDLSDRNAHNLKGSIFNQWELPCLTSLNLIHNPLDNESAESLLETLRSLPSLTSLQIEIPGPLGSSAENIVENLAQLQILNGVSAGRILEAKKQVIDGNLQPRLSEWSPGEPLIERVLHTMWFYIMTYRLADEEKLDETPIWYIMDELGSALRHSDEANFRVSPFMFLPDGTINSAISYSLLWPLQDLGKGAECTRDYLCSVGEDKQRSARLTAWFHTPKAFFIQAYYTHQAHLNKQRLKKEIDLFDPAPKSILSKNYRPWLVYTDSSQISENLSRAEFIFTEDPKEADIVWTSFQIDDDVKRVVGLQPHQYINQFPYESCIVMKHHLAQTMQKAYGSPPWLPATYDMESQLVPLLGDYFLRDEKGENNLWIVKPWNMARTIDTTVTQSFPALIRLVETGPKICQKYIERPALFRGRKFDLRYVVLLRSVKPLEIFLCDVFWARFSNNQYTIEECSLLDYETHFTVMNYGRQMDHIDTHDFVPEFEQEHKVRWGPIHERVKQTLREVFEAAALVHPEMHSTRSRAMYGVDLMIDDAFKPKLLEVTYCPDCARACKYDVRKVATDGELMEGKDFMNTVFGCLFLFENKNVTQI